MKGKITVTSGLFLALLATSAFGQDGPQRLQETIIGSQSDDRSVGTLEVDNFNKQLTHTIEDTVRYIPGVQVNDTGNRFGDDGFNIRGLEGDFINVSVDGVSQGETLNPPSFSPYGMFGSSRGAVEVETVKAVTLTKGPNSVTDGNGALAGSVIYETKSPGDFLEEADNDTHVEIKAGYDDRRDESLLSATFANRTGQFETLLIVTSRDGHETEAHDDGANILGPERGQADPQDRESLSILAKVDFNLTETQTLGVVFETIDREAEGLPLSRDSLFYYDFDTDDTSDRDRIGISYDIEEVDLPLFDSLSLSADYQWLFTQGINNFTFNSFGGNLFDPSDDFRRTEDRAFGQRSYTFAADFTKTLVFGETEHDLVYGVEYEQMLVNNRLFDIRRATADQSSAITSFTVDPTWVPETDITRFSLYIKDSFALSDTVDTFVGLRYDNTEYEPDVDASFEDPTGDTVNDADYDAVVAEAGITWEFVEGHKVALAIGQGFKAPTTQDLYLGVGSETVIDLISGAPFPNYDEISNPNLEPERSTNYEVAYEFTGERTFFRVAAFTTKYDELIQDVSQTQPYGQTISYLVFGFGGPSTVTTDTDEFVRARNVGEVDLTGFEIDGQYRVTDNLNLTFAYSHVDGEHKNDGPTINGFADGDELATAAPDAATLGFSYDAPSERWGFSGFLVWTDEKDESNDRSLTSLNNGEGPVRYPDSWTTLDLFAYYNINDNIRLSLAARNVFDEEYLRWEVINGVRPGTGGFFAGAAGDGWQRYTEPGRSFSVNVSASF
ncbi:MAG: TonB-dependent hemoglobin/transferrin/lactoferrin family receptor [Pseudomonadota bacterium]